jgi:hypothetical protein
MVILVFAHSGISNLGVKTRAGGYALRVWKSKGSVNTEIPGGLSFTALLATFPLRYAVRLSHTIYDLG